MSDDEIVIEQVGSFAEYWVHVGGDKYNVFQGSDDGADPDGWYVEIEIGGQIDGPWSTADDLINDVFYSDEY
jgi:hypothetical protein